MKLTLTPAIRHTLPLVAMLAGSMCLFPMLQARADEPEARERRAYDAATGRNLLNYPPHRSADIRHMRLQLRIPNMNERTMLATETLTIAPMAHPVSVLSLNAALLQVGNVTCPGRTCTFTKNAEDETLAITLDPPLALGEVGEVSISYRVSDPPDGLMWTVESGADRGLAPQVYSQGECESNRYWFAGHDSPNARATCELTVTVPRGYQVVSNGRLESVVHEKLEPYDTFHWVQGKPIPAYLVDLVVGKWDVVDVGSSALPMPVYVPPGQGDRVRTVFGRSPRMVDLLTRLSGEPYPWAKYAQVSVRAFGWGGMENASATTLYETVALDKTALLDGDQDELIVHELAHQWFGDLLTCKSWEHIWLNEGFATYAEALWQQYKNSSIPGSAAGADGLRANTDAYLAAIWAWQQDVIHNDTGAAPYQPAMASKEFDSPDDVFDRAANPYPKGALVLHMLRERLGDAVFFRGLRDYVKKHKLQQVETFQFRQAMEKASGTSLQRFFDQWAFRPLTPHVRVSHAWDAASRTLTMSFEQRQTIDGYNPAFDLTVPVWVRVRGQAAWTKLEAKFDTRTFALASPLSGEPEMIAVDPELATLADFDVDASASDWIAQLASGPTMGARLRAAKSLGRTGEGDLAVRVLAGVVRDDRALRNLRLDAARSLGAIGTPAAPMLQSLLDAALADAPVRSMIIEQLARASSDVDAAGKAALAARLTQVFAKEPSYGVRAAAIRALGSLRSDAGWSTIVAALEVESQHDQIRKAAVSALADMDRAEALAIVLTRTMPGNSSNLRPEASTALGRLAHHDPDRAFKQLAVLIDDREPKTVQAAGKALASIGGSRVRTLFEQRLSVLTSRYLKAKTRDWLRDLKPEAAPAAAS